MPVSALAQRAAAADVIFNTVPVLLLSETVLKALPPETLVIDLASRPGGTDFDAAKRLHPRGVGIGPAAGSAALPHSGKGGFCGIP